jgi:molybdate transport system substrate-binding protein
MRRTAVSFAALLLLIAGCGDDDGTAASPTSAPAEAPAVDGTVNVFAAASLTDAFTEMGEAFEAANPDATVTFNFAGSSALVTQIAEGAPADVFASADTSNMDKLVEAATVETQPTDFATNRLAIVTPKDNPASISALADLANPDVKVALCAEQVPCGKFALEIFARAGITVTPVTLEENVKGVVTKNELGEVDAGIAYVTDVQAAGDAIGGIEIPDDQNVVAHYPIAVLTEAANADGAQAWVDYVLSDAGQAALAAHGFGAP